MCSRDGVGVDGEGAGGGVLMLVAEPQESWDLCRRSSWPERSACPIWQQSPAGISASLSGYLRCMPVLLHCTVSASQNYRC